MTKKKKTATIVSVIVLIAIIAIAAGILICCGLGGNNITIKYMVNGTWLETTLNKDSKVGDIKEPEKVMGYSFTGWYKDPALTLEAPLDEVLIDGGQYYAKFTPNKYKVLFYSNQDDGNVVELETLFNTNYTTIQKPDAFVKAGFTFVGWSNNKNASWDDITLIVEEDATKTLTTEGIAYYAVWKGEKEISITFDKSDMEYDVDMSINKPVVYNGDNVTLPTFRQSTIDYISKIGNPLVKFGGFIVNGEEYNAGDTIKNVTSNLEIKIKWVAVDSYLKFELNLSSMLDNESYTGNTPELETIKQNLPSYSFANLPALTGKFTNYTFKNWNTSPDGTGESYAVNATYTTSKQENTLYAIWQGKKRVVKFNTTDATFNNNPYVINDITSNYGSTFVFPAVTERITQNGSTAFMFGGFKLNESVYMPGEEFLLNSSSEQITFNINWVVAPTYSKLQFSLNLPAGETSAQPTPADIVKNDEQIQYSYENLPSLNNLTHYNFKHWNTLQDGTGQAYNAGDTFITSQENNVLYAIWQGVELNVTLLAEDILYDSDVEENNKIKLDPTQKAIYGKSYTLPNVSQELIQKISHKNQSLILSKFGGFTVNSLTYNAGDTINNLTEDLTISINWVSVDSYLKFDLNLSSMIGNESYDVSIAPLPYVKKQSASSYSYNNLPALNNNQLVNYTFKNWNTARDGSGTSYAITDTFTTTSSENTLYAIYEGKPRTIILKFNDTQLGTIFTNFGKTETLSAIYPTSKPQAEYEFDGYYDNPSLTGNKIIGSYLINFEEETKTFYANFEEVGITLEFNANGGSGSYNSLIVKPTNNSYTFTEQEKSALTSAFTWKLHTLQGFALTQTATVGAWTISLAGITGKSATLYAVWKVDKTEITTQGIEAGEYPQTYVGDALNNTLKSASLTATGKTYTTDINNTSTTLTEYSYNGKKYAKLIAATTYSSGYTFNDGTAITNGSTYFFEVEPIKWDVVEDNGKLIAITKKLLGSRRFDGSSNNWATSEMRTYLNSTFMQDAGLSTYLTAVSHNASSYTSDTDGTLVTDSVWLPTYLKIQQYYTSNSARQKQPTDFARATYTYYYAASQNSGYYFLRSAGSSSSGVCNVSGVGGLYANYAYTYPDLGLCPAFALAL